MTADANAKDIERVATFINEHGAKAHISKGEERTIIGVIGYRHQVRKEYLSTLPACKVLKLE